MASGTRLLFFFVVICLVARSATAAPAEGVRTNSKAQRTDVPPEEEELEFKDVPIFSNFTRVASIPRNPAPGLRYVPVRSCNKDTTPSASEQAKQEGTLDEEQHEALVDQIVGNVMATVQQMNEEHKDPEQTTQADELETATDRVEVPQSTDGPLESEPTSDEASKQTEEADGISTDQDAEVAQSTDGPLESEPTSDEASKQTEEAVNSIAEGIEVAQATDSPPTSEQNSDEASKQSEQVVSIATDEEVEVAQSTDNPFTSEQPSDETPKQTAEDVSISTNEGIEAAQSADVPPIPEQPSEETSQQTEDAINISIDKGVEESQSADDAPVQPSDEALKQSQEAMNSLPPADIDDPDSYTTENTDESRKDFSGYKVYRVIVPTEEVARWLLKFEDLPGIEFWADPKLLLRPRGLFVTSAADLMVAPDLRNFVEEAFRKAKLNYEVLINDVQNAIRNQNPPEPVDYEEVTNRNGHRMSWERYHPLEDIESYIDYLRATFPDFVNVTEIGRTTENRPIRAIRLHQEGGRPNKKTILIDAGIHAREWITPAALTYMIKEIIENPQKYDCIMNQFDWVFIPVLNPDGYIYTHSRNRMWRKTRSKPANIVFRRIAEESLRSDRLARLEDDPILDEALLEQWRSIVRADKGSLSCTGVDANRNFGYKWLTGGSSRNPCLDTYAGPFAFSEPESQALRDIVLENKDHIAMYVSLHAYSQMWLLPWGFTEEKPADYSDLYSLARIGSQALEKPYGVDYLVGAIPDLLYIASGSSLDWVKGEAGVKYSYSLELRDAGRYGFLLPAKEIVPTGVETWAAMFASANELARRVYDEPDFTCPPIEA